MSSASARLRRLVADALRPHPRVVLAVSGGVDSMVLLDLAAETARDRIAAVATFDHGTGAHAREAAALVAREGARRGLPVAVGRAERPLPADEAAWREARWRFLRAVAREHDARVATAHTRDDQIETVLLRALRGAGARGLAGLYARSDVVRPLLSVGRDEVAAHLRARHLAFADDPSNRSRAHLRNRIRLDLLPALRAARPTLPDELLDLARRAAEWREEVERLAERVDARLEGGALHVALHGLIGYDAASLAILWPALAARVGAMLDRRGTSRIAEFTSEGASGRSIQLSGGFEAVRRRDEIVLRRAVPDERPEPGARSLGGSVRIGRWRFHPVPRARADDPWSAELPTDRALVVRGWRPGDRMRPSGGGTARRVKRFLADAHVPADRRAGWPVVLAGDEIVWIPGVRRGHAATDRSGRPGQAYTCERYDHE